MTRAILFFMCMTMAATANARHISVKVNSPTVTAKKLVYSLDSLAEKAKYESDCAKAYDYLHAAKLKNVAVKATKLANHIVAKLFKSSQSKSKVAQAYKSLAHDVKNLQNAIKKVKKKSSRSVMSSVNKVNALLQQLETQALGRGRIEVCRSRSCVKR